MKFLVAATAFAAVVSAIPDNKPSPHKPGPPSKPGHGHGPPKKPLVSSKQLQKSITKQGLLAHAKKLQSFADANLASGDRRTRVFGSLGHNLTVKYIANWFKQWPDYYTVQLQDFVHEYSWGEVALDVAGAPVNASYFTYGVAGDVEAEIVEVANLGCELSDYPPEVAGKVALISRGTCEFGLKNSLAGAAGAGAVILYDNIESEKLSGTLGSSSRETGPYVPLAGVTLAAGTAIKQALAAGPVTAHVFVDAISENRTTTNVLATTKGGNQNNIVQLGAHSDSVTEGPGINDDGSGVIAQLEVAKFLTKYSVKNAVRFSFWTAEEFGLVGSEHWVANAGAAELEKIRLYLNYDMIASPNYGLFIYDGDGSSFNLTGPAGSDAIEKQFEDFFKSKKSPYAATEFSGRSDYGPFLDVGIPAGGLFTGAEGIKTEEEAKLFGGEAGEWYDVNYHGPGDDINNLNWKAFLINTQAIANSVAVYGVSTDTIPKRTTPVVVVPRSEKPAKPHVHSRHGHSGCGFHDEL